MSPASWPRSWELLELNPGHLNPGHVTEQRRVQGRRRVKTDAIDLEAVTELVLAGRGVPVTTRAEVLRELAAWVGHRSRRVEARTALKNQLLGQLDRAFPGLTLALPDVLATKVGRPRRRALHRSGATRVPGRGSLRPVRGQPWADRPPRSGRAAGGCVEGRVADPRRGRGAVVAREMVANDLGMLQVLDHQVAHAEEQLGLLLPRTPFAPLTTVPGWATVRASAYGAAVGDRNRWPGPRQIYRAAGLSPMQYESAGKRRDGAITREGSVTLRRALIDWASGCGSTIPQPRSTRPA